MEMFEYSMALTVLIEKHNDAKIELFKQCEVLLDTLGITSHHVALDTALSYGDDTLSSRMERLEAIYLKTYYNLLDNYGIITDPLVYIDLSTIYAIITAIYDVSQPEASDVLDSLSDDLTPRQALVEIITRVSDLTEHVLLESISEVNSALIDTLKDTGVINDYSVAARNHALMLANFKEHLAGRTSGLVYDYVRKSTALPIDSQAVLVALHDVLTNLTSVDVLCTELADIYYAIDATARPSFATDIGDVLGPAVQIKWLAYHNTL